MVMCPNSLFFFLMIRRPPISTLLPYTTLFRSTVLPYYRITVLPYYRITVLPYYCITVLPYYCITVLLHYHITVLPYYSITVLLYYRITLLPYYSITVLLYYRMTRWMAFKLRHSRSHHTTRGLQHSQGSLLLGDMLGLNPATPACPVCDFQFTTTGMKEH